MDASPILDPTEHVFDFVALFVEDLVVVDLDFPVGFWGDARGDIALGESLAEPVGVITLVTEQDLGFGELVDHQGGPLIVAHLALAEQHDQRPPLAIADGMKF